MKKKIIAIALLSTLTLSIGAVTLTGCGSSGSESSAASETSSNEWPEADISEDEYVEESFKNYTYKVPEYFDNGTLLADKDYCKSYAISANIGDEIAIGIKDTNYTEIDNETANKLIEKIVKLNGTEVEYYTDVLTGQQLANDMLFFSRSMRCFIDDSPGILQVFVTVQSGKLIFIESFSSWTNDYTNYTKVLKTIAESLPAKSEAEVKADKEKEAAAEKKAKEKAAADKAAAKEVNSQIKALDISNIEGNASAIISVYAAYDKLTNDQKELVTAYNDEFQHAYDIADYIVDCKEYDYTTIARRPNDYKGTQIKVTGQAWWVRESGTSYKFTLSTEQFNYIDGYSYGDCYKITYIRREQDDRILDEDVLTVYGEIVGLDGDDPHIMAEYIVAKN